MDFREKKIWITGASSGIGEALATEWAKSGPYLVLSGRNLEKLEAVKTKCESLGAKCAVTAMDLTSEESINKAIESTLNKVGIIDILVNNGGISQRSLAIDTPVDVDRKVMETNFFGAVSLTKKLLPTMVKNGFGHIVVISSIVGKFGFPLRTAYAASKHALQGFFDGLRAEMSNENIHVTIVSPGKIHTNISINAIDKDGDKHGVMDPSQANGMPAEICAKKIIKAVRKNRKDVLIGKVELIMVFIRKYLPFLYYKMASKIDPT